MEHVNYLLLLLILSVVFIIFMTARVKMHAFFVLILTALGVGLFSGLPVDEIIQTIKTGFGNTLGAIGIVIVAGTSLGVILEKTGAAISVADFIIRRVGKNHSSLAMSLTGLIFGIPIFCDSGFVVLSPLNKSLSARSQTSMAVMAVSLGTSLLAIHCFIPPHPGATAAAGIIGIDLGQLMLIGLIVALPTSLIGYAWANTYGKRFNVPAAPDNVENDILGNDNLPKPLLSFMPILIPIFLIAFKSIYSLFIGALDKNIFQKTISFAGDPSVALLIGLALSFILIKKWDKTILNDWLDEGVKNAGSILAITAAGGAFGQILKATGIGVSLGEILTPLGLGIFLPFLIAAGLKTAQGSSTVAVITSASLVLPLLPELHLDTGWGTFVKRTCHGCRINGGFSCKRQLFLGGN